MCIGYTPWILGEERAPPLQSCNNSFSHGKTIGQACGIAGIIEAEKPVGFQLLQRMSNALAHRGPDDAGTWLSPDRRVGLGHRRLAIIDLSPLGHQPMSSDDGQITIVFNGEIYNFPEVRA